VHHLAGAVAQGGEHRQGGLVQVDVLGDRGAELVERQAEPVLARGRVLFEQPLRLERRDQPVRGALAESEPAAQLGHPELLVGVRERAQDSRGVAHRREQRRALPVAVGHRLDHCSPSGRGVDLVPLRGTF
jgi:hypothetical protein